MAENIIKTEYSELMQKSYIDYSMSVLTAKKSAVCYGSAWFKL